MAFHFVPHDVVAPRLRDEALPQIAIGDGLSGRAEPAVGLPARPPAITEAVHHVGGIGEEIDAAAAGDRGEAFDGRHQLHALIRGVRLGAADDPLDAVLEEEGRPAARSRVAGAGAVGVERYSCQ